MKIELNDNAVAGIVFVGLFAIVIAFIAGFVKIITLTA